MVENYCQAKSVIKRKYFCSTIESVYNRAMSEGYISTSDAAERLGITRQRVLQLIERGQLPASKFANVYMIRVADLELVKDRQPGRPPKAQQPTQAKAKRGRKGA